MPVPDVSSLMSLGGGGGMNAPMPMAKPGLMGKMGNPSWWKAILGNNPELPMLLDMLGQQGGDQQQQQAPPPQPPQAQMNPMAVQMAMAMMQGQGSGGPPPMSGAPGLYGGF